MGDTPWQGDACSLVDEFRAGHRSPAEELQAVYDAVDRSSLNAICHTDSEAAFAAARAADVNLPFGGVPMAVKELESVSGWPDTHASFPLRDRIAASSSPQIGRAHV